MGRLRLSTLLVVINVGLLLLAVGGVAVVAVGLLRRLADEQALARVRQAGITAQQAVERASDQALTAARLLGERPTLLRLLQTNDTAGLASFLGQFQRTSGLDGSAVLLDGRVVAQSGAALPWTAIAAGLDEEHFLYSQGQNGPLAIGATAAMPSLAGGRVMVALLLDEAFTRRLGDEVGLPVTIVD